MIIMTMTSATLCNDDGSYMLKTVLDGRAPFPLQQVGGLQVSRVQ